MKKINWKKALLLFAILSFCMGTVSALQVTSPTLGNSDADPNSDVSATFTITNNDDFIVSSITVNSNALSKYQITFENKPASLGPGASKTVTVKGHIPEEFKGQKTIGKITVTGEKPNDYAFGSHTFNPSNQSPSNTTLPVGLSATNDDGPGTSAPNMPVVAQWHVGRIDWNDDIFVNYPEEGSVDAGWVRIHSNEYNNYWIRPTSVECGGNAQTPPPTWLNGGKIHTSPGECDGKSELDSGDSGWISMYTRPEAEGQLIFVIAENACNGGVQSVPANGVVLGKVKTGPGKCDGKPEGFSYNSQALDSGSMYIVFLPIDHTPPNYLPIGELESVTNTSLSGWAYDADIPATTVHVFMDGTYWKELTANESRQDLVDAGSIPDPNHGFTYTFVNGDLDFSNNHTFNVYAINSPIDDNPLLDGSPIVVEGTGSTNTNTSNTNTGNSTNTNNNSTNTGNNSTNTNNSNTNTPVDLTVTAQANLKMEAKEDANHLVIDRVKLNCDKLETVREGDTMDDVYPGQSCFLTVRLKNTFTENIDIEDIDLEFEPESRDIDDAETEISRIRDGNKVEKTLEFQVDEDADDGKVKVKLTVEGTDELNKKHSDEFEFTIEIERLKHDLPITRILTMPTQAHRCEDDRIEVYVYVENKGLRDEDDVAVELNVPALNFKHTIDEIELEKDEDERVKFAIPISSSTPFGSFTATATSFFDNAGESQSRTTSIVVVKCDDENNNVASSNNNEQTTVTVTQPVVAPPPANPNADIVIVPPKGQETSSFSDTAVFTGLLVFGNLIALTVLGVMGYGYFRKKKVAQPEQPESQSFETEEPPRDYY